MESPRNAAEIEEILDEYLEAEFYFRDSSQAAKDMSILDRAEQDYLLIWVKRAANAHFELANQFAQRVVSVFKRNDRRGLEAWLHHAMDVYDHIGLRPALDVISNADDLEQFSGGSAGEGVVLQEELGILQPFAHGLSGRKLKIAEGDAAYTDSEIVYLPAFASRFENVKENFLLYKSMIAYQWAQTRFGTFRIRFTQLLEDMPEGFLSLFHSMDTIRLEACIERELPGLHRDMMRLKKTLGEVDIPATWYSAVEFLRTREATSLDVMHLARDSFEDLSPLPLPCYAGEIRPDKVEACMAARLEREKKQLRTLIARVWADMDDEDEFIDSLPTEDKKIEAKKKEAPDLPDGYRIEIEIDGQPLALPEEALAITSSIVQDLGHIPDDYLTPAGPGEYDPSLWIDKEDDNETEESPEDTAKKPYQEFGPFFCNEWDYRRQHYHKNWCSIWEKPVTPVYDKFVQETLQKYGSQVKHLRRTFEAMRDEDKLLKRQVHGDDVDIDAIVEALVDARDGSEMSDRLFTRMYRAERNIAVMFMIDMSGSTKGWINEAIRESLLLLSEALESLGDRYAIYGFSGMKRTRCVAFQIKDFNQKYDEEVRARISGIRPQDYTRMGFAIRHLGKKLLETEAKKRILIAISDGKPEDWDRYRGEYSIEDTRRALIEARRDGIHPYCITIDTEAHDYLPYLFGGVNYTFIDDVRKLPLKVSDIYRRLTV